MKKLWLPIVIVSIWLLVFVAGPWYASAKVEQRLDALVMELNTNGILKFEKTEYKKGLLSSEVTLSMSVNMDSLGPAFNQMGGAPDMKPVVLKGDVKHGPFLLDDGFDFAVGRIDFVPEISAEDKEKIAKVFGTETPLDLFIQFNWDNSSVAGGALAGFSIPDEGVTSNEATLSVDLTDSGNRLVTAFNWDGLTANKPGQDVKSLTIGNVSLSSDQVQAIEDIWVGGAEFNIASVEFSDMGMKGIADNFTITSNASIDDSKQFMSGAADFTLSKVAMNEVTYVEDLVYKVSFKHVHVESAQKLAKAIREAQQAGGSPEAMQMAMGMQMMGILPEIVKSGFSLNIDAMNAKVMGEQVDSNLKIEIAEGTDVSMGMAAIAGVTATADISVSKALLDKFPAVANPQMIQALVAQGMIVEENGNFVAHAEFKAGQLTVNGNPIPLPF